jgi:hypothetical protein
MMKHTLIPSAMLMVPNYTASTSKAMRPCFQRPPEDISILVKIKLEGSHIFTREGDHAPSVCYLIFQPTGGA